MDIFVYSDESGVFDAVHNDWFVFGGIILLSKKDKDAAARRYLHAERIIRKRESFDRQAEVKATTVSNTNKGKLYRSLNHIEKFGVVVEEKQVIDNIWNNKKSKQRYLDYVYKIGIKRKFEMMIHSGILIPSEVQNIHFYVDEHTTATDGRYELQESLEQEFRFGTNNWNYSRFFPPIFQHLQSLEVRFCNSSTTTLVRAADIVANKLYFRVQNDLLENRIDSNFLVTRLPHEYRWQI